MGYARTLKRGISNGLVVRIVNGMKPPAKPLKRVRAPRPADTYRGARRLYFGPKFEPSTAGVVKWRTSAPRSIKLNRSRNHPPASSYAHAKRISGALA